VTATEAAPEEVFAHVFTITARLSGDDGFLIWAMAAERVPEEGSPGIQVSAALSLA
jgi:hypothetical protein